MKNEAIRKFIDDLIAFNWVGESKLDEIVIEIVFKLKYDNDTRDLYIDEFGDWKSKSFKSLTKELFAVIERNIDCPQISLVEKSDGYYITKVSDNSGLYKRVIDLLNSFESKAFKGEKYEKFCVNFLCDIGIETITTKASNDKGIDLIGSYKVTLSNLVGKFIHHDEVYILGQTKYFGKKIDTPVIRKLVGDSLFIRFDDIEYVKIKHNAFHLIVISHNGFTTPAIDFAKKNKIELYDTQRIAHLISQNNDGNWSCMKAKY